MISAVSFDCGGWGNFPLFVKRNEKCFHQFCFELKLYLRLEMVFFLYISGSLYSIFWSLIKRGKFYLGSEFRSTIFNGNKDVLNSLWTVFFENFKALTMEIEQKTIIKKHRECSFTQSFVFSTDFQIPFAENAQKIDTKKQRKECLEKFPKVFFELFFSCRRFRFFIVGG